MRDQVKVRQFLKTQKKKQRVSVFILSEDDPELFSECYSLPVIEWRYKHTDDEYQDFLDQFLDSVIEEIDFFDENPYKGQIHLTTRQS